MTEKRWERCFKYVLPMLLLVSLLLPACTPPGQLVEPEIESVFLELPQLSLDLDQFIGKKVWVLGFYGDSKFGLDGAAFLLTDFDMLTVSHELPEHSFARLDGELPPADMNSAEIIVYGQVQDFGTSYDVSTTSPTPLITVEEYQTISPPTIEWSWSDSLLELSAREEPPTLPAMKAFGEDGADTETKVYPGDRALIISGAGRPSGQRPGFRHNIRAKYNKLLELGFEDNQIDVIHDSGSLMYISDLESILTKKATKQNVQQTIDKYKTEMKAGNTLLIFVTGHGTGYHPNLGWRGARPAFPGTSEFEHGETYPEEDVSVDLRKRCLSTNAGFHYSGSAFFIALDPEGRVHLWKRVNDAWQYQGGSGDGDKIVGAFNLKSAVKILTDRENFRPARRTALWDSDVDGVIDVRARWDGTRYVLERLEDGNWTEMARDTNGDFIINNTDGGIDWNLDGDKDDQIGFHEGISLWGEILWDDELADMLEPLDERCICILVEMDQCMSGGFIPNLEDIVQKIVTITSEDEYSYGRKDIHKRYPDSEFYSPFEIAFAESLEGIDTKSWNEAYDKAVEDDRKAREDDGDPTRENKYQKWETATPRKCVPSVNFTDHILETIIRTIIGILEDLIYPSDLEDLTVLVAEWKDIADLTGLEHCRNLIQLALGHNQIDDISPLANLTNLTYLGLYDNQISDISPLANLTNLTYLSSGWNEISDISPLANLTSLTELYLRSNQISDISPLVQNEGLGTGDIVSLNGNPLSSDSINIYIPQLEARGVTVNYDVTAG